MAGERDAENLSRRSLRESSPRRDRFRGIFLACSGQHLFIERMDAEFRDLRNDHPDTDSGAHGKRAGKARCTDGSESKSEVFVVGGNEKKASQQFTRPRRLPKYAEDTQDVAILWVENVKNTIPAKYSSII